MIKIITIDWVNVGFKQLAAVPRRYHGDNWFGGEILAETKCVCSVNVNTHYNGHVFV